MEAEVSHLWRHPIKAHGVEPVASALLETGRTFPWDRIWAIAHEAARVEPGVIDWQPCTNFNRGAKAPAVMAIRCRTDEDAGTVTLTHPDRAPITVNPDDAEDAARLVAWVTPLCDPDRARPSFVVRGRRGLTDSGLVSIAILNQASRAELERQVGQPLAMERFRGNIWLDGLAPWAEFDLEGAEIRIGEARLRVIERITRCKATMANPDTGRIDADTLGALQAGWGHSDFGVYAEVTEDGLVAVGSGARLA